MAVFFTRDDCGFSPKSQKHIASTLSVGAVLLMIKHCLVSLISVSYSLRGSTADDSSARRAGL